jgi:hypothetical protein
MAGRFEFDDRPRAVAKNILAWIGFFTLIGAVAIVALLVAGIHTLVT